MSTEGEKPNVHLNIAGSSNSYDVEALTPGGHQLDASQPTIPPYHRQYGNPAPLGLLAYGTVFLCSSLFTLNARGITTPNLILVFAIFYGGIFQTLVGMWEMFLGNTFGATVFATYGGFNFSFGALYLPQIGLAQAYTVDGVVTDEFTQAVGIYLSIWCLITALFLVGALRSSIPVVFTLGMTVIALACLAANSFTGIPGLATAGGALGICASMGAYYAAMAGFYSRQATFEFIRLPHGSLAYPNA